MTFEQKHLTGAAHPLQEACDVKVQSEVENFSKLHLINPLHPLREHHLVTQFQDTGEAMADLNHLYGACACERNQYTVIIPSSSTSLTQVFFDNSAANRESSRQTQLDMGISNQNG